MTPAAPETVIAYIDDAAAARDCLPGPGAAPAHWILVACAPRMTHRVSKWVSHSAREHWRTKWADRLFAQVAPALQAAGHAVTTVVAKGPLPDLTRELILVHGPARIIDARRPRAEPPAWNPGSMLGLGAAFVLAID